MSKYEGIRCMKAIQLLVISLKRDKSKTTVPYIELLS